MTLRNEKTSTSQSFLTLSLLFAACLVLLGVAADGAKAFTKTINDIEDPRVESKVLGLDVQAHRTLHAEVESSVEVEGQLHRFKALTVSWNHSLSGLLNSSVTEAEMPRVIVDRNPTKVRIVGKLATKQAEGVESVSDFIGCLSGRTTTKSAFLDIDLDGFYQDGTPTSSGKPDISLKTENLDPWSQSCPYGAVPDKVTQIQAFSTPSETVSTLGNMYGTSDWHQSWFPSAGEVTTVKDGCTAEYCDFTISGYSENSGSAKEFSGSGNARANFNLKLRLEYPPESSSPTSSARIVKAPRKVIKSKSGKAKVTIRFKSTGPRGAKFRCRLDRGKFSPCSSPFKQRVGVGKHRFAVVSVYNGRVDRSPAISNWTVRKTGR